MVLYDLHAPSSFHGDLGLHVRRGATFLLDPVFKAGGRRRPWNVVARVRHGRGPCRSSQHPHEIQLHRAAAVRAVWRPEGVAWFKWNHLDHATDAGDRDGWWRLRGRRRESKGGGRHQRQRAWRRRAIGRRHLCPPHEEVGSLNPWPGRNHNRRLQEERVRKHHSRYKLAHQRRVALVVSGGHVVGVSIYLVVED
jgi:hypothetical protein